MSSLQTVCNPRLTKTFHISTIVDGQATYLGLQYIPREMQTMKEVLSKHEWILMEALWNGSPMFLSQIIEATKSSVDWNSSSYSTYLKRMTDKGFLTYKTISGYRCYSPKVAREDCIETQSSYILYKMTEDSKRLLLASMIEKSGLSDKDRAELQELITRLGSDAKKENGHEGS